MRVPLAVALAALGVFASAGSAREAALRPETIAWGHGSQIAVVGASGGVGGLYLVDSSTGSVRLLTTKAGRFATTDWAPDGRAVAFESGGRIYTILSDGSGLRSLGPGIYPRWSPDGQRIAFFREHVGLFVMSASGTGAREIVRDRYTEVVGPAAWAANGRRLAYIACTADFLSPPCEHQYGFDVYTIKPNGTGKRRVSPRSGFPQCVAWSSLGALAYSIDNRITLIRRDGRVRRFNIGGCPVWAPVGQRFAAASGKFGPIVANANGSGRKELPVTRERTFSLGQVAWSADGRRLAYQPAGGSPHLFVIGVDGRGARRLLP